VAWRRPQHLFARKALTDRGWLQDVLVTTGSGEIVRVEGGARATSDALVVDLLLPGIANVHSHVFQRGMAGLTESASPRKDDNFWTWREVMFAFALALTPEQLEAIAAAVYIEMLKHGYTAVGEFHYLHQDTAGKPYASVTELSDRVIAGAQLAGIQITHLPVLYETADFGGKPATPRQRRFVHSPETYLQLVEALLRRYRDVPEVSFGVAPHSLRATKAGSIATILSALPGLGLAGRPVHLHIAEQAKEVADCVSWSGRRPVGWLMEHLPVDANWCLIHATHVKGDEVAALIGSGATAGLCPTTEANLGDGVFPAEAFVGDGGRFGVGSDSNVCLSPFTELRSLEYAQRLMLRKRAVLAGEVCPSVGRTLFEQAARNGARALGLRSGVLAPGYRADLIAVGDEALLEGREGDRILDTLIFAMGQLPITHVIVGGRLVIEAGRHSQEDACAAAMRQALRTLCTAI
jgi:formimidoylglutamate deiminase